MVKIKNTPTVKRVREEPVLPKEAREEVREPKREPRVEKPRVKEPVRETFYPRETSREREERPVSQIKVHKTKYKLWIVAGISIFFFIFALSYLFGKVVVAANPKVKDIALSESFSANKDGSTADLPFDLIVISGEEERTIKTTEEKEVAQRAEGVVVIYNAFSSAPQLLSIDTRLEGSNGKMYKTKKQIVVPGMKGEEPGSLEVSVYAAEAGVESNAGPLDFKIFGFKGTPKYAKFYARSKGSLSGGYVGKTPYVSDTQKASAMNDLKAALQAKLFKKAADQIPNGFIMFKDGVFLDNIIDESSDPASGANVTIKKKGTLYGLLFDEKKLNKKIAKNNVKDYDGSDVYLSNIKDLKFTLTSKDNTSFADIKNINFNLSGSTKIVWRVDEKKLSTSLLGKTKKDFNQVLLSYPNIESAELTVSPFWKTSLPDKSENIHIVVNYPK